MQATMRDAYARNPAMRSNGYMLASIPTFQPFVVPGFGSYVPR
jgi:hypothetical protein